MSNKKASASTQAAIDAHLGRIKPGRNLNPRNSKVKDALADEATRFEKFEDFAKAYWDACARGLYWYATDEKRFHIGAPERKAIDAGKFVISCSPSFALAHAAKVDAAAARGKASPKNAKPRRYVAELNVNRVPESDIRIKRNDDGTEIKITGSAGSVKVTRVLDADAAKRAFAWQLSILPSSKEELRKVWESAWAKRAKVAKKRSAQIKDKQAKESRRAELQDKRAKAAAERAERSARAAAKKEEAKKKRAEKAAAERAKKRASAIKKADAAKRASEKSAAKEAAAAKKAAAKEAAAAKKKSSKKATAKKASAKKVSKKPSAKAQKGKWVRVMPNPVRKVPFNKNAPGSQ